MATDIWRSSLQQHRAIAVIRASDWRLGQLMAQAAIAGGLRFIEITWNSDRPAELIAHLRAEFAHCWIGAGTLLTVAEMQTAIDAGAQFLFSPHTHPPLIHRAIEQGIPVIPGALSPTEIVTAWQAGATCVKVFPVESVGVSYIRSLQAPLGHIPLIPTGGVTLENAGTFIQAGAIAVGLSGQLFPKEAIATQRWHLITQQAQKLVAALIASDGAKP